MLMHDTHTHNPVQRKYPSKCHAVARLLRFEQEELDLCVGVQTITITTVGSFEAEEVDRSFPANYTGN